MASLTLTNIADRYPDGTAMKAYLVSGTGGLPGNSPSGTPAATATVASRAVTFTGLTEGEAYWVIGTVAGAPRWTWARVAHDPELPPDGGAAHGSDIAAIDVRLGSVESGRFIVPAPTGVLATDSAAILATITAAAAAKGVCEIRDWGSRYVCSVTVAGLSHVKIRGDGTLHNPTASAHALSLTDCPDAEVEGLWVQGEAGTFDGIHLERCPRSKVKVRCRGSGRNGVYAEECIGIDVDAYVGIDVQSPYPAAATDCTGGVKLTWDGVATDSGCNQFRLAGWYVIGKDRGWAVEIIRGEGGVIESTIPELSKGGIKLDNCQNLVGLGYYGEANPSDVEYTTGTAATTNGSTTVVGTGTAWNTNDAQGNKNAMVGKFLIIGTTYGRVASITDDTHLELEAVWAGATLGGQAYRLQSGDLYMLSCRNCTILSGGRGGGAVILEGSSGNMLDLLTESLFLDANSNHNYGRVITNRASTSATRKVDNGTGNYIDQLTWRAGGVSGVIGVVSLAAARLAAAQTFTGAQTFAAAVTLGSGIAVGSVFVSGIAAGDSGNRFAMRHQGAAGGGTSGVDLEFGDGVAGRDTTFGRRKAAEIGTTNADISTGLAGKGFRAKEGANAKQGVSTLVAGTVTVANTSITANSRILLTVQALGTVAAPKAIAVTARVNGTSFTITSADATDTSVVAWEIFEPA